MLLRRIFEQAVGFLRVGQPPGAAATGYAPLLALMQRQVSDDDIAVLAATFARHRIGTTSITDIGVAITEVIDGLPRESDIQRVSRRLVADGWIIR
jgi:hypothetical protein